MIFEVSPDLVARLDPRSLVELLRRLLHVEAQKAGVVLRGVSVPLNITAPDGGEDARISWTGGAPQTDYLPSRFCIFQSKAKDPGVAGWKKEVWSKATQKKNAKRKLNEAVTTLLAKGATPVAVLGEGLHLRLLQRSAAFLLKPLFRLGRGSDQEEREIQTALVPK